MSELKQQQQQQQAAQQQAAQQQMEQQQQQQTIQVLAHDASQQLHAQAQVVSSGTSTMVMSAPQQTMLQHQSMQNMQSAPIPSHSAASTITTMSSLGQHGAQSMADWQGHGRVQVIQQPLQNPTYVQQVYNQQGQLLMPGNIALHPSMNQGSIQVIAAGKPFQSGQMQHMLTAQGKQLVQGQATSFQGGYATIPTSGNNQTLVISPLGVQHLMPQQQQQTQQQQKQDMQKVSLKGNGNGGMKVTSSQQQSVTIASQQQAISSQAPTLLQPQIISPIQYTQQQRALPQGATQAMQFAPWQFNAALPQGLTWAPSMQGSAGTATLLAQGNQIFIRQPQPDQGMFHIHNATQATLPAHTSMQAQQMGKNSQVDMQKAAIPKAFSTILPNGPQQIRPASVSTQTGQTQTHLHQATLQSQKSQSKVRTKTVLNRSMPSIATQKSDAANQTKGGVGGQNLQPKMNGGQTLLLQQDKMMRSQQLAAVQQLQQQQLQQMFQQQLQPKPGTGQIMMGNAIQGQLLAPPGSDRPVMPVVSMPPGVQAPLMAPMVVQSMDQVQAYPQGVQMIAPPMPVKVEDNSVKEDIGGIGGDVGSGPGRPDDDIQPPEIDLSNSQGSMDGMTNTNQEISTEQPPSSEATTDIKNAVKEKDGDRTAPEKAAPPKAMVKPQVLTHVIEGFVIQEASEPFAVNRGVMDGLPKSAAVTANSDEPPKKKMLVDGVSGGAGGEKQYAKCEVCGKVDLKSKYKPSKRFCSLSCAKRYNVGCSTRVGLFNTEDETEKMEVQSAEPGKESSSQSPESTPAVTEPSPEDTPKVNPLNWTVTDVKTFIGSLPGCAEYAEDFAFQEIDGQALMLLKEDHLMSAMSIKLGPALKIVSKLDTMRVEPAGAATPKPT